MYQHYRVLIKCLKKTVKTYCFQSPMVKPYPSKYRKDRWKQIQFHHKPIFYIKALNIALVWEL